MTIPLWCLAAACLLPYIWSTAAIVARSQEFGVLDNKQPRAQLAKLQGWGNRASAAHKNAWEALAVFAPAVLCAHVTDADATWSLRLSLAWVAFRIVHGIVYIADADKARTVMFTGGFTCALALFVLSAGWL